jgi:hypothetical protein
MRRQMGLMIMPRLITAMKLGIVKRVELRKTGVIWGQIWGQNHTWWQIWGQQDVRYCLLFSGWSLM